MITQCPAIIYPCSILSYSEILPGCNLRCSYEGGCVAEFYCSGGCNWIWDGSGDEWNWALQEINCQTSSNNNNNMNNCNCDRPPYGGTPGQTAFTPCYQHGSF